LGDIINLTFLIGTMFDVVQDAIKDATEINEQ
jgi:hypothetical protein